MKALAESSRSGLERRKNLKVCVCSDSHGNAANIDKMLVREKPDAVLFLGDGVQDFLEASLPKGCRLYSVAGNCDFCCQESGMRVFELEGVRILMVHGHRQAVKYGLLRLELLAQEQKADIALYGHTHRQDACWAGSCLLLCPGSVGSAQCSYAVLELQAGRFDFSLKPEGSCSRD